MNWLTFLSVPVQILNIFYFVIFVDTKIGRTTLYSLVFWCCYWIGDQQWKKIRTRIHNTALQNSSLPWNCVFIIARWCRKKFSPNIHSFFFYFLFHQVLHFYLNIKVFRLNFWNNLPKRCLFWKNFSFERFWSRLGFKEAYTKCAKLKLMQSKGVN